MADAHFLTPPPINEPVRGYAPGSPERASVRTRLEELTDARTEVPMVIDGRPVMTADAGTVRAPHRHELVVAEFALGGTREVDAAITAALRARAGWAATPYAER
ncbi:MAG: 1-pyrroline-5-carboxylate dehydrogenase, partial [Candidatus Dormibacteria bacterium]